jgi:hypothetical protein
MRELQNLAPHPDLLKREASNSNFQLGDHHVIAPAFNLGGLYEIQMKAYLADLPRRNGLERWLAFYKRKLFGMRKRAALSAFALAA